MLLPRRRGCRKVGAIPGSPKPELGRGVSRTAEFPWILLIMALVVALSWVLAGWRTALLSVISLWGSGPWGNGSVGHCPAAAFPRIGAGVLTIFRL